LTQRRNHILLAAIDALAPEGRELLQTLALLQSGAEFETLKAFNPHLPPGPEQIEEPEYPAHLFRRSYRSEEQWAQENADYDDAHVQRQAYVEALAAWKSDPAVRAASTKLWHTIRDLEGRGLLQYDLNGKRYDLHPVVRGVAAGRMGGDETREVGQRVVDYFTSQLHDSWESAETLGDIAPGLQVMRVLLRMRRYQEALRTYEGDLANALSFNLDANTEIQALLRPFFPDGWDGESVPLDASDLSYLLNDAAMSLSVTYPDQAWRLNERGLVLDIRESRAGAVSNGVRNLSVVAWDANRLAESARLSSLALEVAELLARISHTT
jgi:tetratricopeptide (TPR) repeat protein